jgi:hypothetical protein
MFLHEHLSTRPESTYSSSQKPLKIIFWHVQAEDVDKVSAIFVCDPIKGTMKIHSIYSLNKNNLTQLFVKDLACFCEICLDSCWTKCVNVKWIGHWVSN